MKPVLSTTEKEEYVRCKNCYEKYIVCSDCRKEFEEKELVVCDESNCRHRHATCNFEKEEEE